ncbi:MAG: hypothetical protein F4X40_05360 [Chloroflexi bacterium]|nr:hypothetical protein [Chloroflexota bacterium]
MNASSAIAAPPLMNKAYFNANSAASLAASRFLLREIASDLELSAGSLNVPKTYMFDSLASN